MQTEERKAVYRHTPEFKARHNAYMRKWYAAHPGYRKAQGKKYYAANAEECRRRGREQWSLATPEKREYVRQRNRRGHLRRKYNLTPEAKELMYKKQRGRCYLCTRPFSSCLEAKIEHNHYTNEIRGLAHVACNTRLGFIEKTWHDDKETFEKMLSVAGIVIKKE